MFIEIANLFDGHAYKCSMIFLLKYSKLNDYTLVLHCYRNLKTKYFNQYLFPLATQRTNKMPLAVTTFSAINIFAQPLHKCLYQKTKFLIDLLNIDFKNLKNHFMPIVIGFYASPCGCLFSIRHILWEVIFMDMILIAISCS